MKKKDSAENRKFARLALKSNLNFSIMETGEVSAPSKRFRGEGTDIGVEGIQFTSNKQLKKGTILNLEIFLPGKEDPVYIEGEVMWCTKGKKPASRKDQFGAGVRFLTVDKNHVIMLLS